ncbi:growth arrest-specific protein 2-like [Hydractinia symbiolongicarpus]|uniref:growth arrest-specific protein 2-like n=1 Tax=Hydractinia symbiolongicarpus TaxID=13093 RepID=UPI00254ACDEB|nr:growth arrest-specific protein 2-like [Hydractinia symbiolongicarpus]
MSEMCENNNTDKIDEITAKITERNEQSIVPLLEDVADWLTKYMSKKITPDDFLDVLDNGILLFKLAEKIQKHSEEYVSGKIKLLSRGVKTKLKALPGLEYQCHHSAKKESFFARENAANFLKWCRSIGIQDSTLFESEGLVLHKQLKNVVLTLLELARIGYAYEIDPIPSLIKLEKEIEQEEVDGRKNVTMRKKKENNVVDLDSKVQASAKKQNVLLEKVKDGKYIVNGKATVFVRILRNHVMVRVGGGWDELEHFLSRHNPQKIGKILTSTPATYRGN